MSGRDPETGTGDGGARILIIDDQSLVLRAFRTMLEPLHRVVIAEGGAEGIGVLDADRRFDVILCDLSMPEVDGIEVYRYLEREAPELLERIVFSTGGAYSDDVHEFLCTVDNELVQKPLSPIDLRRVVERVLGRSP